MPDGKSDDPQFIAQSAFSLNFNSTIPSLVISSSSVSVMMDVQISGFSVSLFSHQSSAHSLNSPIKLIDPQVSSKLYSRVVQLKVTRYEPTGVGILGPSCIAVPDGKSSDPQLAVQSPFSRNFISIIPSGGLVISSSSVKTSMVENSSGFSGLRSK